MSKEWIRSSIRFIWETLEIVIIALAIILPIRYFLATPFMVKGASMEPNFHDYNYLVIEEISYRFHNPERGDIVVLKDPEANKSYFIKRVIGLPHEKVEIKDGSVYIYNDAHLDGAKLDESVYLSQDMATTSPKEAWELGEDEYFVMGDNRKVSLDSRRFGPINKERITGRTWIRAFPFTKMTIYKGINYSI